MDWSNIWASLSAIGQIASAIISIFALLAILRELKNQTRQSDLSALGDFYEKINKAEQLLGSSIGEKKLNWAFNSYLDLLEVYATAVNYHLCFRTTEVVVRDKLMDALIFIELNDWSRNHIEDILNKNSTSETYAEIAKFMKCNRRIYQKAILAIGREESNEISLFESFLNRQKVISR